MRLVLLATALCTAVLAGQAHAQAFTPQELDRMSQERLNNGQFRNLGPPPPQSSVPRDVLHQPQGLWVCMGTNNSQPILAAPRPNAPQIGIANGRIAAGADQGDYTSVLFHEGTVGYVPKATVRPYQNEFSPRATCTIAGIRPNGVVVFSVR